MTCGGLSSALWAAHRRRRLMENRAMQNLPGKTAFVTGGASGIGLGIAKALLGAGMKVVIADIREDHLASATAELGAPDRVLALELDVTDRAAYARAAEAGDGFHLFRTKEEVGQRVLEGILNDELYILTHSEFRQGVEDRAQAMCAAVPDLPENEEYKRTFGFLFVNPIHAAETARQRSRKDET